MKRFLQFFCLSAVLLLLTGTLAFAGVEPYENFIKGKIKRGDTLLVKDEKFKNPKFEWSDITNISVKNSIAFRITNQVPVGKDFTCTISLKIEYLTSPGQTAPQTKNVDLKVNYSAKKGVKFKFEDLYTFTNAYWVRVIVDNIYSAELGNDLPADFQLVNRIVISRQYKFQKELKIKPNAVVVKGGAATTQPASKPSLKSRTLAAIKPQALTDALSSSSSGLTNNNNSQLQLTWQNIEGADEYDIEWTTANDGNDNYSTIQQMAGGSAGTVDPSVLDNIFLHNATRITTTNQSYLLSLPYNDNYILVRMRQVQYTSDGIRILGDWDYSQDNGQYAVWQLNWYQQSLNWQYSAAFAEEGKKKEVVSYFDGTLRNRQSVTLNNSDNVAVFQEGVYDEFGRQVANILPAPYKEAAGASPYLRYMPNLNVDNSNQPYNSVDIAGTAGACEALPATLSTGSGASQYYSAQNPFMTDKPYNGYIPDAQGYPVSVSQYTADNTGRLKIQGGVGQTFQPGNTSPSKTTKYYYGQPGQWELDQLFGNDVGIYSHYFKNMVVDPNGQISISYVNASGKTIATALTGSAPAGMDAVRSISPVVTQTTTVLSPSMFVFKSSDLALSATTTYLASVSGSGTFTYNIQKLIDSYPGGTQPLCSNCYYDLTIEVLNDCNTPIYSTTTPIQIGSQTANCNGAGTQTGSFSVSFPAIGEYYITFNLAFSRTVMENYVSQFVLQGQQNGTLKTEFNFILPQLDSLDFTSCLSDCTTNEQALGAKADFIQTFTNKLLALGVDPTSLNGSTYQTWVSNKYDQLKAYCDASQATCGSTQSSSPCQSYETQMDEDVSPGGQYALFDGNNMPLETSTNVIYKYWRTVFPVEPATDSLYIATEIHLPDGSVTSPYDANFTLPMLVQYWNDDWAEKFLPYHPEYCKLLFCYENESSEFWDQQLQNNFNTAASIPTIPGASGLQYDDTNAAWLVAADPFFNGSGLGASLKTNFQNDLNNYSANVLKANSFSVKSLTKYIDYTLYCSNSAGNTNILSQPNNDNWDSCTPLASCRVPDREWNLYKNFYLQLKQQYYDIVRANTTCASNCQVGTPVVMPGTSPCPATSDFSVATATPADGTSSVGCDSLHQTMVLTYVPGAAATSVTVTIAYSQGISTTGLPTSFVFAAGDHNKFFCVPNSVPAAAITVQSVVCPSCQASQQVFNAWQNDHIVQNTYGTNGSIISTRTLHPDSLSYFYGILTILPGNNYNVLSPLHSYTGNWSMDDSCRFALYGGNVKYTLYSVNGSALALGHREGNFEEIWYFNSQGASLNCSNPATLQASATAGNNAFYTGTYPTRHQLTIIAGTAGSTPAFTATNSAGQQVSATSAFYSCLAVSINGSATANYQNVWVFDNVYDSVPDTCSATLLTKQSRFDDTDSGQTIVTDPGSAQQLGQSEISQQAQSSVNAAADNWISILGQGLSAYDPSTISTLRAKLIEVALMGGDINHPFGASTVPPGEVTASGYTSFGDAIKGVLGISTFTSQLNPWLISFPYPYSPQMQAISQVISYSSPSICNLLQQLQAQCNTYNTTNGSSLTLFNYLTQTYGSAMTLSASDLASLQNSCGQCQFLLDQDITLPVFMDPTSQGCVMPSDYATAKQDLQNQFGNSLSVNDPNYEEIYTNFMNQRWGFTLTYAQYSAYDTQLVTNSSAILCNQVPQGITVDPLSCIESQAAIGVANGKGEYATYIAQQEDLFRASYISTCSAAQASVNLQASQQIYHYTLYYYDQADNLIRTVPPEGVVLLSASDITKVQAARSNTQSGCTYNGPASNSDKPTAFTALSTTLSASTGAIEMWLYNSGSGSDMQVIEVTPDNKYLFQAVISGNQLGVDIYPVTSSDANTFTLSPSSIHYRADITALQPLQAFTHLVIQGSSLGTSANAQVFLNGHSLTLTTTNTPVGPGFTITAGNGSFTLPDNITPLKHLRFYSQPLSTATILANASNTCFNPTDVTNMTGWYRFNTPTPGGPTTIADNSTVETQVTYVYPAHRLTTTYAYNSTDQVSTQQSPDGGTNRYWHDLLSRLVISQNDKQLADNDYSYTILDVLGRITEVGQKNYPSAGLGTPDYIASTPLIAFDAAGTNSQITDTYYDASPVAANNIQTVSQNNLRKRIAVSTYREHNNDQVQQATYYDYDIDGNVKTLYQQISGLNELKQLAYEYDLISGKVNFLSYQNGKPDQFYYQYNYDADNRLTEAWSAPTATISSYGVGSTLDPSTQRLDASYQYYLHGPLARMELGDVNAKVQGLDYVYTLQGWLKGVNSQDITQNADVGQDGMAGSTIPRDAYGYSLGYYNGDYQAIGGSSLAAFSHTYGQAAGDFTGQDLFNGNISNSTVSIAQLNSGAPVGYTYHYDQLNRLKKLLQHGSLTNWTGSNTSSGYNEAFTYDGNGNILTVNRAGANSSTTDNLTYQYNTDANGNLVNNKLTYLQGTGNATGLGTQGASNYQYDQIGNLTDDYQANVHGVLWNVYGKIQQITTTNNGQINYYYDPAQHRAKKVTSTMTTWYICNAQGNTIAVYDQASGQSQFNWTEQHLYGNSRIGIWTPNLSLSDNSITASTIWQTAGSKEYELTNHLGNVLATVTDITNPNSNSDGSTYYTVDVSTAQDYYAFGALMPNRTYTENSTYRYGFNGKENDNEVKGTGDQQDYGMRIYDPRVGKFLSIDPMAAIAPYNSPYLFAGNKPIVATDFKGLIEIIVHVWLTDINGKRFEMYHYTTNITTAEDIRGIMRNTLEVDVEFKNTPYQVTTNSIGYVPVFTSYSIRKGTGETEPEEIKRTDPLQYYLGQYMIDNPFGTGHLVLATYDRDPLTGEYQSTTNRVIEAIQGGVSLFTMGRGTGLKKYVIGWAIDFSAERLFKDVLSTIDKNGKLHGKEEVLGYYLLRAAFLGKKEGVKKLLQDVSLLLNTGKSGKELFEEFKKQGIDLDLPKDNQEAIKKLIDQILKQ